MVHNVNGWLGMAVRCSCQSNIPQAHDDGKTELLCLGFLRQLWL